MKILTILSIFLIIFYIFTVIFFPFIEFFELKIMDLFYRTRGTIKINPDIVIVGIDEYSLTSLEAQNDVWPWSRYHYGKVIKNIFKAGAKVVLFDISFTEEDEVNPKYDNYLASILSVYRNVVLGSYLINEKDTYKKYNEEIKKKLEKNITYLNYTYKMKNFKNLDYLTPIQIYKVRPPILKFSSLVPSATYEIGEIDIDGVVRSIPLFFKENWSMERGLSSGFLPHMDVLAVGLYKNSNLKNLIVDFKERKVELNNLTIPFDSNGLFRLFYYGDKIFPEIPFYDVETGKFDPKLFKDKIVIIGYTATAKGLYDLRITPFSNNTPGVFIHATAIQNMINKDTLNRIPIWGKLVILIFTLIFVLLFSRSKNIKINLISFLSIPLILIISYVFFLNKIYIDCFYPIVSSLIISTTSISKNLIKENREKKKMKEYLYRYVPDSVADFLVKKGKIELGGEEKNIVVLFSDIKGFTALSEKLEASKLVEILNNYLTKMSNIIRNKYQGTIDKFVGDAIMAIFGAPVEYGNEVERALKCALDMRKELEAFNKEYNLNLDSGIGIHIGPAIVGNIGAPFRMDYTSIGDTVNTCSRIEHLTRDVPAGIIVSEDIYNLSKEKFEFKYIGKFKVKGKSLPLKIYELKGEKHET
ncbi:adenylate cyclase [Thermosipho sp. 1063]|uniref:CHASE2 domain-containing protein n=1 Tax=unclassified Thermosipho (in: thermotogales) TaxID=2676525 RepID=UPI0009493656|nr:MULTISPECIES: adenylate/guanylate cyclase domain-containing protein [unclassified Thermosipho (in: thermotogales)]ANQ53435.1 adenylate cyclase [Thermosipho sp. 1070]APT71884.1 adenylate cyclase [Thermosipho sp. 1063]OOC45020.1 adenylate cyclase [Thermosipho sp. 1074]